MTEHEIILATVTHPAGFEVGLFAMLNIYRLEDGRYAVVREHITDNSKSWEEIFEKPEDAVDLFIKKRNEMQLGFDIERELFNKEKNVTPTG